MPGDGGSCWWPVLSTQGRYAIVALGVVVAITNWDGIAALNLSIGQTALRSDTLNIGDHP